MVTLERFQEIPRDNDPRILAAEEAQRQLIGGRLPKDPAQKQVLDSLFRSVVIRWDEGNRIDPRFGEAVLAAEEMFGPQYESLLGTYARIRINLSRNSVR